MATPRGSQHVLVRDLPGRRSPLARVGVLSYASKVGEAQTQIRGCSEETETTRFAEDDTVMRKQAFGIVASVLILLAWRGPAGAQYPTRTVRDPETGAIRAVPYNPYTGVPLTSGPDGTFYGAGGTVVGPSGAAVAGRGAGGGRGVAAVGVNPYTGDVGGAASGYNAATGTRGQVAGGYNPYTGGSAAAGRGYNPRTGTAARGAAGYNPYTGNKVAAGQSYNARTGQQTSFKGSYNPLTGNGSYVNISTPGAGSKPRQRGR